MSAAVAPFPPPASAPAQAQARPAGADPLPGFAHRVAYAAWFESLGRHPNAPAAQRRLIPHLDAALEPADRLALWQALWHNHRRLSPAQRARLRTLLDGRFAERLDALDADWDAPTLVLAIARLGAPRTAPPHARARWVWAWLAHHGCDPVARPAANAPELVMLAVQAAIDAATGRLDAPAIEALQAAVLDAAGRDASLLPQGLAVVFELALHARDEATACATLAELIHHGHAGCLRPARVGDWLDGRAVAPDDAPAPPLQLSAELQRRWLQPAAWALPSARQALRGALRRAGPRSRLDALDARLLELGAALGAGAPARAAAPDADALRALQALDAAYALVDAGADPVPALQALLDRATFAPASIATLYRARAAHHAAQDRPGDEALALVLARRHQADPALRQALSQALVRLGAAQPLPEPPDGRPDAALEAPCWERLAAQPGAPLRLLAHLVLARLHTDGLLEPQAAPRRTDWARAAAHWAALDGDEAVPPAMAALARRARQAEPWLSLAPLRSHEGGREHLWIECPGARRVLVVPACVASHHTWPEVAALRGRMPGHHLLFVNNPEKNWYCDEAFEAVCELVRHRVLGRFAPAQVSCWYGSMGGHGAIKLALAFGFRAMAFNPQVDLDLWAAFRPEERALLWSSRRHRHLLDAPDAAWARTPLYLAVGSDTPDREALSLLVARWRELPELSLVVEKFEDPHHAGLMSRISGGPVAPVLARIDQRLSELAGAAPVPRMRALDRAVAPGFWQALDEEAACAVEVQVRGGRLWWQPSAACGTRPASR